MDNEIIILNPLDDKPVETGYVPNFSIPTKENREAEERRLHQWAENLLKNADEGGYATISYPDLLHQMSDIINYDYAFLKEDPWRVKNTLRTAGVGAAPDSALEKFNLKTRDKIIIYRAPEEIPMVKTRQYKKAVLLVKFLTLMLPELSANELTQAENLIDQWVKATRFRRHIYGLMRWYNQRRRLLDARTKKMAQAILTNEDKVQLANQLLAMAANRGATLEPKSIYQLDRLLQFCDYQPGEVHSLLHRWQCGNHVLAEHTSNFNTEALAPVMNIRLISEIESQTEQVQTLLAEVMEKETEDSDITSNKISSYPPLMIDLLEKPLWTEKELNELCELKGLKLGPTLEAINDYAIEKIGDTIVEMEGDTAYVTTEYREALVDQE